MGQGDIGGRRKFEGSPACERVGEALRRALHQPTQPAQSPRANMTRDTYP